MKYPAHFEAAPEGGYTVTFRDIPEAITQGDTLEEARAMAADALLTAMDFYFEDGRTVPLPSSLQHGEELVALPLSVWTKVQLLNLRLQTGTRPADMARAMGIKPQEVTRILDLHHPTKIGTLEAAFRALDARLDIYAKPAMDYQVIPMADGLSMEQLRVAAAVFRTYIDATLGGSIRARNSFLLFAKRERGEPLSEADAKAAQEWQDAESVARDLASRAANSQEKVSFIARLA